MSYKTLGKLFYEDKELYKSVYQSRINSEACIKIPFQIKDNEAFFVQSNEVIMLMYNLLKLDKEIHYLESNLPGIAKVQYLKKCLIDEIVVTNNIEGVHSSRKEIGEALDILEEQSEKKGKRNVFIGLVNKYLKLLEREHVALKTCQDVRDLYDEIVSEEVLEENKNDAPDGRYFRKGSVSVFGDTMEVIHTGVFPEQKIIGSMTEALSFLEDEKIIPLYRICIFHYLFEYIHPFYNGNGRLGRLILSYGISQNLEPLLAFRISKTIKENINKYYKSFVICNDKKNMGDLTPFLIMMLEMMVNSAEELIKELVERTKSWDQYEKMIPDLNPDNKKEMNGLYSLLIQASLFSESGISTQELLDITNTTYATLGKRLARIKSQELLIEDRHGNKKYYQLNISKLDS